MLVIQAINNICYLDLFAQRLVIVILFNYNSLLLRVTLLSIKTCHDECGYAEEFVIFNWTRLCFSGEHFALLFFILLPD
jgi:hypothetical protein